MRGHFGQRPVGVVDAALRQLAPFAFEQGAERRALGVELAVHRAPVDAQMLRHHLDAAQPAAGFGASRSAALQTMLLNSWPNSTAGSSTRRCTPGSPVRRA
ncbi:MAG TPA: hypothetical protein PKB14_06945 [Rubrivivax sp.]|nr:hypothetical protein [Rubrivivax sp.]